MKLYITLLAFILSLSFFSCSKDVNRYNVNGNGYGIMDANINGTYWSADNGYAQNPSPYTLTLYASRGQQSYITINISGYTGPGDYILGGYNTAIFYDGYGSEYDATSGTITITTDNNGFVQGYFYFSGLGYNSSGSVNVTNGTFNLNY